MDSCENCELNVTSFLRMNEDELKVFLINHGVLKSQKLCPNCGKSCIVSGKYFICRKIRTEVKHKKKKKIQCSFRRSIYSGTFFSGAQLSLDQVCRFVLFFITTNQPKTNFLQEEIAISRHTVVDWTNFTREVLMHWAIENSDGMLGGEGKVVEIDEAQIGHRKFKNGRWIEGQWVFGCIERDTKKMFVVPVKDRTRDTLLEVIKRRIAPGSVIYTDCWKAYDTLEEHGYTHARGNQSQNIVDATTGAHTRNIGRHWRELRSKVPKYGRVEEHLEGYIAEFLFLRKYPKISERIHNIFKAIGSLYAPTN